MRTRFARRLCRRIPTILMFCRSLLTSALLCLAGLAMASAPARATVPGVDSVTLVWDTANRVYYGGYNTPIFTTLDNAGRASFAYCVDPSTTVPPAGPYQTCSVEEFNPYWVPEIKAAMWFGYGGPGFDPAMWPTTWNDGSPMDAPKYYAATHLILSYATTQNTHWVYYNAGSQFINYGATTFLGVDRRGNTVNPNSTMFQMFTRAAEVPPDYVCYYLECGRWDYVQYVIAQDPYERNGSLVVEKTSLIPDISTGSPCYTLEGAAFGVYQDEGCTQLVATITTGANGHGRLDGLRAGTYWVKETGAPPGYALNTTAHRAEIPAGSEAILRIPNTPQADRPPLLVQKTDAQTGGSPQGGGSLAGAEFTIRFYAGTYEASGLPPTPTRTWVFVSNAKGEVLLDEKALVRGDALYRDEHGIPVLPLGTVTVQETKAPVGYMLSDTSTHLRHITPEGRNPLVSTYRAPTVADAPARGGLSVQKIDADTGQPHPQGAASMAGAEFRVVSTNPQPVVVNNKTYATGETVLTLVTDEHGFAATAATTLPCGSYQVYESKAPEGYLAASGRWDVAIASNGVIVAVGVGADTPHRAAAGPEPMRAVQEVPRALSRFVRGLFGPSTAMANEMNAEDRASTPTVSEHVIRGGIRARKVDADTGTGSPQGDASLKDTEFSIISLNSGPVVVDGVTYQRGSVVKRIYSDEHGVAQTGERDLPYGYYSVEETGAPPGYLRSAQVVHVNRDGVIVEVGRDYENEVQRGGIRVQKIDSELQTSQAQGDATLAGAEFTITNASENGVVIDEIVYAPGEVVMAITTGADGIAQTGPRDLPFGTYTVTETRAPNGYHLEDGVVQTVEIRADDTLHDVGAPFANHVVRGGISLYKCDADTGERVPQGGAAFAGAVFAIANANDNPVVVNEKTYWPGETVAFIATDASGHASTGNRTLPVGTYTITETTASPGYLVTTATHPIHLSEEGVIVALPHDVPERVQRGGFGIRKFDGDTQTASPQGSATLQGAHFDVRNANDNAVVVQGKRYAPGETITTLETNRDGWAQTGTHDLPFGTYEVVEITPPTGYHLGLTTDEGHETGEGTRVITSVDGEWSWHSYESDLYNHVVRGGIGITKTDAELGGQPQGNATLEGAEFTIANASASPVVVEGTTYKPGEVIMRLTTDAAGHASTEPRILPFGTYTVTEVKAPVGYALDEGAQTIAVTEEGVVAYTAQPYADTVLRGGAAVRKVDADIGFNGPQGAATYQGAVFEIVNTSTNPVFVSGQVYQPNETVATITTDASGYASTVPHALPFGSYRIREIQAPNGYLINEAAWTITITDHGDLVYAGDPSTAVAEAAQKPGFFDFFLELFRPATAHAADSDDAATHEARQPHIPEHVMRGGVAVQKIDAETGSATPQGDATLEGTRFAITSLNQNPVVVDNATHQQGDTIMVITSDATGKASTSDRALPYGRYAIGEMEPPPGYQPASSTPPRPFVIDQDGVVVNLEELFSNSPIRGGLSVQKLDAETNGNRALGGASLAGTRFTLINASPHPVRVQETLYSPGEAIMTLVTDIEGRACTDPMALPFGTYQVVESQPPEGYKPNSGAPVFVTVGEQGQTVTSAPPFLNRVIRGDIAGIKIEDGTGRPMANVAFSVTSLTTGETHVLVTNESGAFSTASSHTPHSRNTNANDAALDSQGNVANESLLSWSNGLWFSGTVGESTEPDDALGALPFDRYRFDELLTSASHGHTLVHFELSVREEGITVDAGTIDNSLIGLSTTACFTESGAHEGAARSSVHITDTVSYTNLTPGETYELEGTLVDRITQLPLLDSDGNPHVKRVAFTPTMPSGTVQQNFALDALSMAGVRAVVFERLFHNNQEIAVHTDPADNQQTVTFVAIGTKARGQLSGTREEQAAPSTCVVDTVTYDGLTPGQEYLFSGVLIDKATGEPLRDATGRDVATTVSHTPSSPHGSVEIAFVFDGSNLAGHTVVAFESVYRDDQLIASHANLDDAEQTVSLVGISTTAFDQDTGTHQSRPEKEVTILDAVLCVGLEEGAEYVLEGLVVDAQTGIPLLHANDIAVGATVRFTALEATEEVVVPYTFDATDLADRSVVVIETLWRNGAPIASHADLTDPQQTIYWAAAPSIPSLGQSARHAVEISLVLAGAACACLGVTAALLLKRESHAA